MNNIIWHNFASGEELAETLAKEVAEHLSAAVQSRGTGLIAVSGGSTPPPFFRALSNATIDWPRITVTLVDERFVPPSADRSNARLAAQHLLQRQAASADFVGLYHDLDSVEEAADHADRLLETLPLPLDVAVLGMGTDGHTASFFPDADNLPALLDVNGKRRVLPVHTASGGEPRLTLTMPLLRDAGFLALHIEGAEKKAVLEKALAPSGDGLKHPIRAVVEQAKRPVHVYWAPAESAGKPGTTSGKHVV